MNADGLAETRVGRWLSHRRAPLGLALLAALLAAPAVPTGLMGDDYFQRIILLRIGELGARLSPVRELFDFVPAHLRDGMVELGVIPWWSDPSLSIAFARPLSALSHVVDYALWPDTFALHHLHSLLWFALAVGLVGGLYRRLCGSPAVAGLAGLLFAVEDAHALNAGWVANRNALLCLVAGALLVGQHVQWQRTRRARALALALLFATIGLACGEATLGALAYVVAWQFTCEERSWRHRLWPLVPYALVVGSWRVLYGAFGYGVAGSSLYTDPGREPLLFLTALLERAPLLLSNQWLGAPINLWLMLSRPLQLAASAAAAACLVPLVWLVLPIVRRERLARFWGLGMLIALVPICAAFPMDRLLLFAGVGAFGLIAELIASGRAWSGARAARAGWRRKAGLVLLALHGPLAAVLLVLGTATLPLFGASILAAADQAPRDPAVSGQALVFVNGNDFPVAYLPLVRQVRRDSPPPRRVAQLASTSATNDVRREDRSTLVITPEGGFLAHAMDRLLADPVRSFVTGQRIERPDFVAEVRDVTADGRPATVAFHFRRPLDDPGYRWLFWRDGRLIPFPLPDVGERMTLAPSLLVSF